MLVWLSIIIATLCIQIPNIWAISKFNEDPSFKNAMFIAACCIPTSFLSTACYAYFYGHSFKYFSYPVIAVSVYGISLLVAFIIQSFILKSKPILIADIIAVSFVIIGIIFMIFRNDIQKIIG